MPTYGSYDLLVQHPPLPSTSHTCFYFISPISWFRAPFFSFVRDLFVAWYQFIAWFARYLFLAWVAKYCFFFISRVYTVCMYSFLESPGDLGVYRSLRFFCRKDLTLMMSYFLGPLAQFGFHSQWKLGPHVWLIFFVRKYHPNATWLLIK